MRSKIIDASVCVTDRRISCLGDFTCSVQGNGCGRKWCVLLKVCLKWNIRRLTVYDLDVARSSYLHCIFPEKCVNLNFKSRLKFNRIFSGRLSRTNLFFVDDK